MQEFEQSGMTRAAFCRARGIGQNTLAYHRRKHGNQGESGLARLLPVQLVGLQPSRGPHLRVELANGRRIAVEDGFDAGLLKRLVAALEG